MFKKFLIITIILTLSGCSLFSGSSNSSGNDQSLLPDEKPSTFLSMSDGKIKKFSNVSDLKTFLQENDVTGESNSYYRGMPLSGSGMDLALESVSLSASAPMAKSEGMVSDSNQSAGSSDYSKTNVQVEGVDESDIIKTDGKYIYALVKNDLYIINAFPAEESEIVSKISFKSRPEDIYINGDNLIVFGQDSDIYNQDYYRRFIRRNSFTFFKVFDTSDKKNPKQIRDLEFEGDYTNSRMIGDYVYFVTSNYNYYYIESEPVLPRVVSDGSVLSSDCVAGTKCFAPDIYYFDIPYESHNFTSINAINVVDNSEAINGDVYLMSNAQDMYVSENNIYITYTKYINEYDLEMEVLRELVYPMLKKEDQEKVAKIEAVDSYILSKEEKRYKIQEILERFAESLTSGEKDELEKELEQAMKEKYEDVSKELEKTVIHKIAIDKNNLEYKTSGEVTGHVLNQFAMDENDGYFRIATTKSATWSQYSEERESYNNLYVLDSEMKVVGSLENLARGERIYSVRFMQGRAYVVTFKQVDPLFVIDLNDPKDPRVLGELKIPGYSDYLHPYDENTLIGFGKDTGENEWGGVKTLGLKLSLFDVSDVSKPREIDTYIMGGSGSDSIALSDHRAFLFSKDKNLLSLPVSLREELGNGAWGKLTFSGAMVINVDKNGFELKGKIDHSDGGAASQDDYWMGYSYYDNTVKRSLYIDNVLYTFSNNYLKMNSLTDLKELKTVEIEKKASGDDDFIIVN